jgi:hypothetical protein
VTKEGNCSETDFMASKYHVILKGRLLALAYVSPHPVSGKHIVASVIPIERTGKWEDTTLEFHFKNLVSDLFVDRTTHLDAIRKLLTRAGVDGSGCTIGQAS